MPETEHERGERLDQYFTPPALAKRIVEWASIQPGDKVLEPSCGDGALVRWMPQDTGGRITVMDIDSGPAFDFLKYRAARDAFDVAIMNPPYGWVGSGKTRAAADRLHVQHALRMSPRVVVLARANFLWGAERYQHVMRFATLRRMAVLVNRPSFYGPALLPGQDSARHDFGVFEFRRPSRYLDEAFDRHGAGWKGIDDVKVEYWTDDWRLAP